MAISNYIKPFSGRNKELSTVKETSEENRVSSLRIPTSQEFTNKVYNVAKDSNMIEIIADLEMVNELLQKLVKYKLMHIKRIEPDKTQQNNMFKLYLKSIWNQE